MRSRRILNLSGTFCNFLPLTGLVFQLLHLNCFENVEIIFIRELDGDHTS